jgi:HSP20 family protein
MSRSNPWSREASSPLSMLQHELNRMFEAYLNPARSRGADAPPTDLDPTSWSPAIDVYELPDEIVVLAEIPGVDPAKLDLAVTGNVLSLRGTKEPGDLPEPLLHSRERRFGAFHRQLTLSNEVDFDRVAAEATNGILKIRLPKRSPAKPRTIPIRPS